MSRCVPVAKRFFAVKKIKGMPMNIKTTFTDEEMKAFEPAEKIGLVKSKLFRPFGGHPQREQNVEAAFAVVEPGGQPWLLRC